MRIDGTASWTPALAGASPSVYSSAASRREDVDTARNTAMSALHNDRFRRMLEWISDPRSSEAAALMRRTEGADTDYGTASARYAENSE